MRHHDPKALNLFSRLSTYVPREGEKRVRHPLEDFCTEALAYCLIYSPEFRTKFVSLIPDFPNHPGTPIFVHTQHTIKAGRPDLVLEASTEKLKRQWNGEVKLGADLRESQLGYLNFLLAPQTEISRHLTLLPPKITVISWETVHRLLEETAKTLPSSNSPSETRSVVAQFADFLAEKGLKNIQMKTDIYRLSDTTSFVSLLNELTEYFEKLRPLLKLTRRGNPSAAWDYPSSTATSSYYGIYGAAGQYAGIEFNPKGEVFCYYQEQLTGKMPEQWETFECDAGKPGEIWVTARAKFPAGNQDKTRELENIFEGLQKSLRAFAAKNSLSGASASDTDEES